MVQPPLLTTCFLCLLGPIVKKQQEHILMDTGNHAKLIELAQDHVNQFEVLPSPAWLCQRFLAEKPPTECKIEDQGRKTEPIIQATAALDAVLLPSLEGAGSNCSGKPASPTQDTEPGAMPKHAGSQEWYATVPSKLARTRCKCKGNCLSKCPGRWTECPNTALDPPRLMLCKACKCSVEVCTYGARRPHGVRNTAENYGYCQGHYPNKPAKK